VLPSDHLFINDVIVQKTLFQIIIDIIDDRGAEAVPAIVDKLKKFGFKYATASGTTWGIDEVVVPKEKTAIVAKSRDEERKVIEAYDEGLLSRDERRRMIVEIWHRAKTEVEKALLSDRLP
jgi:DNA-directed RNA polymerase subunit beta'